MSKEIQPFCVVSAENAEADVSSNIRAHANLKAWLDSALIDYVETRGKWGGVHERCALVPLGMLELDTTWLEVLNVVFEWFKQDAILRVFPDRACYLYYPHGCRAYIGQWTEISEAEAKATGDYTEFDGGKYWRAVK